MRLRDEFGALFNVADGYCEQQVFYDPYGDVEINNRYCFLYQLTYSQRLPPRSGLRPPAASRACGGRAQPRASPQAAETTRRAKRR